MSWNREQNERTRSIETLLSDARDQRIREAGARAIGEWLEANPRGYSRPISTLTFDELTRIGTEAVAAFIRTATEERMKGDQASVLVNWLCSA